LPAGVFNPYAGVKTSILLFDNELAKKTKEILFLKIQNDGHDLGAQRREIDKNDLPLALEIIKKYRAALKDSKKFELNAGQAIIAHLVTKDKIAESGDYNLSGDRYIEAVNFTNQKWPMVELGEVCGIFNGSTPSREAKNYWENGTIPWFTIDDIREQGRKITHTKQKITEEALQKTSVKLLPKKSVLLCCTASVGEYAFAEIELTTNQQFNGLVVKKEYENKLTPEFLFCLSGTFKDELNRVSGKTSFNFVSVGTLKKIKIPLPPIEVQKEIVEQIEVKQKAIEAAKAVIDSLERERRYFGQELRKIKDVKWVELDEVCEKLFAGGDVPKDYSKTKSNEYKIPIYSNGIGDKSLYGFTKTARVKQECVTISARGTIGFPEIRKEPLYPAIRLIVAIPKQNVMATSFLKHILETIRIDRTGNSIPQLTVPMIKKVKIPLPPLEVQKQLVAEMEEQEKIIEANKKLIGIMEQKISEVLDEI